MKLNQFLLLKLAEECNEVAKRAIKQIQFGPNQSQSQDGLSAEKVHAPNKVRLRDEILDVVCIVQALVDLNEIDTLSAEEIRAAFEAKMKKIGRYLAHSVELGEIEIDD